MLSDADIDKRQLPTVDDEKVCGTPRGCENPADVMVWCDHHIEGCDYTGYRCRIHLNMLVLDTQRQLEAMRKSWLNYCGRCENIVQPGELRDHLRWIPL